MMTSTQLLAAYVNQNARDLSASANAETAKWQAMGPYFAAAAVVFFLVVVVLWARKHKNS